MKNFLAKTLVVGIVVAVVVSFLQPLGADPMSGKEKININTASSTDLQQLPRIGPKVAQRIIDFREKHGKFKRVEDLMKVKGIGKKIFEQNKNVLSV